MTEYIIVDDYVAPANTELPPDPPAPRCTFGIPSSPTVRTLRAHGFYEDSDLRWNFCDYGDRSIVVQVIRGSEIIHESTEKSLYRVVSKISEYGDWKITKERWPEEWLPY